MYKRSTRTKLRTLEEKEEDEEDEEEEEGMRTVYALQAASFQLKYIRKHHKFYRLM